MRRFTLILRHTLICVQSAWKAKGRRRQVGGKKRRNIGYRHRDAWEEQERLQREERMNISEQREQVIAGKLREAEVLGCRAMMVEQCFPL